MLNREMINSRIQKRQIVLDGMGHEYNLQNSEELGKIAENFEILYKFIMEENGIAKRAEMPQSIKVMQNLELVDYEPASDSGHFRFYPKGCLLFDLIKKWADEIALNRLESIKIETPMIYDYNEPDIKSQVQSFHERHYKVRAPGKEREFILRFAGDFGLFRMMKDVRLGYKNLPLRVYEYSKSFRYEKSGELAGLKRLRGFSMPDIHSFSANLEEGFKEYKELYRSYYDLAMAMDIKFVAVFRIVENFYLKHKNEIQELADYGGIPVFIELLSDMKHYWAIKSEFQAMDSQEGFLQLSTVQLDVKDAEVYGINYLDIDGQKKGCIICHSSIGSIERWIYAVLESAINKDKPELSYWLSPIQMRLIPVNNEYLEDAEKIYKSLKGVRCEIDDRNERLGRKIRDAEKKWIPFVIVIGEREVKDKIFSLRTRNGSEIKNLSLENISEILKNLQGEMPFIKSNLYRYLSIQPVFRD